MSKEKKMKNPEAGLHIKICLRKKIVILYLIGIFAYVGTEQGVSYWISKFLYTYYNYNPIAVGASIAGWFWGMISIGCLIGLGLIKLFDSRRILVGAVIAAGIFLAEALFGPGNIALYAFPMVGFSLSVMWSIIFSLALNSVEGIMGLLQEFYVQQLLAGLLFNYS